MIDLPSILAASDSRTRLIFIGVIFLIFWAVQAVGALRGKSKEKATPASPPQPFQRMGQRVPPVPRRSQRQAAPRKAGAGKPPPLPAGMTGRGKAQSISRPAPPPPLQPQRRPTPAAQSAAIPSRAVIKRWVDVKTLRSQFIMAEALKPPLALRKKSHLP